MSGDRSGSLLGGTLVAVLVAMLCTNVFWQPGGPWNWLVPLAVLGVGLWLAMRSYRDEQRP